MASTTINVLLSTFPGLDLPRTLNIPLISNSSINDLHERLLNILPRALKDERLSLSTTSNEWLPPTSTVPLSQLLSRRDHEGGRSSLLPLRLTVPTLGGKGGFGSQLRAAGGRMASRKKNRNNQPVPNSNRNLDGRRLRTVGEAKALAEYLAVKPEMEKKEKEERRKRWEDVVATAERREQEIKEGKYRSGNTRGDGAWVEEKEEVETKVRDSIREAMAKGLLKSQDDADVKEKASSEESDPGSEQSGSDSDDVRALPAQPTATADPVNSGKARKVFGWDEEDDDISDSDEDSGAHQERQ